MSGTLPAQRSTLVLAASCATIAATSCGAGPQAGREAFLDPDVPTWSVGERALLHLRAVEFAGESVILFGNLRAAFADDGRLAIAVSGGGENRVALVSVDGEAQALLGRTGAGPGEFQSVSHLFRGDDHIVAWDRLTRRLSLISLHTAALEQVTVRVPTFHSVVGLLDGPEGRQLVTTPPALSVGDLRQSSQELSLGEARPYAVWDLDGGLVARLRGPPEPEPAGLRFPREEIQRTMRAEVISLASTCLPQTRQVTIGDRILVADSKLGMLWSLNTAETGKLIFQELERVLITDEMLRSAAREPAQLPALQAAIGRAGDPLPAVWSAMVPDASGRVWLRRATCFEGKFEQIWQVIDTTGWLVANVLLPDSLRVMAANGDQVLAGVRDTWGEEHVTLWRLGPAGGGQYDR